MQPSLETRKTSGHFPRDRGRQKKLISPTNIYKQKILGNYIKAFKAYLLSYQQSSIQLITKDRWNTIVGRCSFQEHSLGSSSAQIARSSGIIDYCLGRLRSIIPLNGDQSFSFRTLLHHTCFQYQMYGWNILFLTIAQFIALLTPLSCFICKKKEYFGVQRSFIKCQRSSGCLHGWETVWSTIDPKHLFNAQNHALYTLLYLSQTNATA